MTRRPTHRRGYTLFELVVVMAILILLALVALPSTSGLYGETRIRGAADQLRGELAAARAWAMEDGVPVRVAVSEDGRKVRRAPEPEFDLSPGSPNASPGARRVEVTLEKVTAEVLADSDGSPPPIDGGWVTVAVFLPDGTCRAADRRGNPVYTVALKEDGRNVAGLHVTVRALTGQTQVVAAHGKAGGQP